MLTFKEIESHVFELAEKLNFKKLDLLPTYGTNRNDARPHIEIDFIFYDFVVLERGKEVLRKSTTEADELFYWISKLMITELAIEYSTNNRNEEEDFRKLLFDKEVQLMELLNEEWAIRLNEEINEVLKRAPYNHQTQKNA